MASNLRRAPTREEFAAQEEEAKRILYAQDTITVRLANVAILLPQGRNEPVTGAAGETKKPRLSGAFVRWAVLGSNQ